MAVSKNARRVGAQELVSRWGGEIRMFSVFGKGRVKHFAECQKTKNRARKPKMLM